MDELESLVERLRIEEAMDSFKEALEGAAENMSKAAKSIQDLGAVAPNFKEARKRRKKKRGAGYTKRRVSKRTGKSSSYKKEN